MLAGGGWWVVDSGGWKTETRKKEGTLYIPRTRWQLRRCTVYQQSTRFRYIRPFTKHTQLATPHTYAGVMGRGTHWNSFTAALCLLTFPQSPPSPLTKSLRVAPRFNPSPLFFYRSLLLRFIRSLSSRSARARWRKRPRPQNA